MVFSFRPIIFIMKHFTKHQDRNMKVILFEVNPIRNYKRINYRKGSIFIPERTDSRPMAFLTEHVENLL